MTKKSILIIKSALKDFCTLFFPTLRDNKDTIPIITTLKCVIIQKILRINSHVNWPVHWTSQIRAPENISRGTRFPGLSIGCYIDGRNGISIGKNTWIGPRVSLISMSHDTNNFKEYLKSTPIVIGDNCWLATNVTILSGVEIGNHTIVASGAVVTKSFPNGNQILAGVPAKVVKTINDYNSNDSN